MELQEILKIVEQFGTTVVVLGASLWFIYYMYNKNREDLLQQRTMYQELLKEEQEKHSMETDKLTEALNNNTLALQKISDFLERKE